MQEATLILFFNNHALSLVFVNIDSMKLLSSNHIIKVQKNTTTKTSGLTRIYGVEYSRSPHVYTVLQIIGKNP